MKTTKFIFSFLFIIFIFLTGCIKDDFVDDRVDPVLRFTATVDTIELGTTFQFTAMYLNNVGKEEVIMPDWSCANTDIIVIDANGLAEALAVGETQIMVSYETVDGIVSDQLTVNVGETTVVTIIEKSGTIATTSSYELSGMFTLSENGGNGLSLEIAEDYKADTGLPGLYIYLSNNPSTTANALEIGPVQVFSGAHDYQISNVGINDYSHVLYFCKPFNVKVGDGLIE